MAGVTTSQTTQLQTLLETKIKQIAEFGEAIDLLQGSAKYTPAEGDLEPFDKLKKMLDNVGSEEERSKRLISAQAALNSARAEKAALQVRIERIKLREKFEQNKEVFSQTLERYQESISDAIAAWDRMKSILKDNPEVCPGFPPGTFAESCSRNGLYEFKPIEERFRALMVNH